MLNEVRDLGQKGFAHIFVVLILLAGIAGGLYLLQHPQILKSRAASLGPVPLVARDPAYVLKEAKIAVVIIKYTDTVGDLFSKDDVQAKVFGDMNSVRSYYKDVSHGVLDISGDMIGPITYPAIQSKGCDPSQGSSEYHRLTETVDKMIPNLYPQVDLKSYTNKIYLFPKTSGCGMGDAVGSEEGDRIWLNGQITVGLVAHELGHNFGLVHGYSLTCKGDSVGVDIKTRNDFDSCFSTEGGDVFDVMGARDSATDASLTYYLTAPHALSLGWIPTENVQPVLQEGTYHLVPLESGATGTKALKIYKPDSNEYYYVEYRQPTGLDANLPNEMTQGFSLRIWSGDTADPSRLIKTSGSLYTGAFADGQSFTDEANGISIKQISHSVSSLELQVKPSGVVPKDYLLGPWYSESSLPDNFVQHQMFVVENRVWTAGGGIYQGQGPLSNINDIYSAKINANGDLGSWSSGGSIPYDPAFGAQTMIATNYRAGGNDYLIQIDSSGNSKRGFVSKLNADGTVGQAVQVNSPPGVYVGNPMTGNSLIAAKDYLFYFVKVWGKSNYNQQITYKTKINDDGTIGDWTQGTPLPKNLGSSGIIFNNGFLYVVGGGDMNVSRGSQPNVYMAQVNDDGLFSAWTEITPLPLPISMIRLAVMNGYLFETGLVAVSGGSGYHQYEGKNMHAMYASKINADGTLGEWVFTGRMPKLLNTFAAATDGKRIYLGGGMVFTTGQRAVYSTEFTDSSSAPIPTHPPTPILSPVPTPTPTPLPITKTGFTLSTPETSYTTGEEIPVSLFAHSDTAAANLFSAKINYDSNVLKPERVDTGPAFIKNWVEQYTAEAGKVSLVGGVPNPGIQTQTGSTNLMATIYFKALKEGITRVSFDDSSAIHSNANNTNILTSKTPVNITITRGVAPTPTRTPTPTPTPTPAPTPTPSAATPNPGTGDGNKDGRIDLTDLSILLSDINKTSGFRTAIDLNGDGLINSFDFSLMRNLLIQKNVIKE